MNNNAIKLAIAFTAGVAAGAVAGILFAPDKGEETRKKIAETAKQKFREAKDKFECKKENSDQTSGEEA